MTATQAEPEQLQGRGQQRLGGQRGVSLSIPGGGPCGPTASAPSPPHTACLFLPEPPTLLLLLSLLLIPLGLPVLCAPPRLICDSRVLERYILEAKEAENVTVSLPDPTERKKLGSRGSGNWVPSWN